LTKAKAGDWVLQDIVRMIKDHINIGLHMDIEDCNRGIESFAEG
jgi:hypothetical protein